MPAKKKVEKPAKKGKESESSKNAAGAAGSDSASDTAADRLRKEGIITTFALSNKKIHRNVRDINVTNLTVTFHGTPIIEEAELTLNYGNRYGYIGRNGCGKSTFMKVIAARCFPIPEGIDIFHLHQEIEASEMTAKEAVMAVDQERAQLEAEAEELNDILTNEEGTEEADIAMERLTQVYERLEELDSTTAETRASKILNGLGFSPERQNKKTKEFSGGWRMRIALARALFIQPTLLLLDEPTNHLDMEAVVWLEDYLSKWKKILFLVSHSQDFLNNVCTHIVHHRRKTLDYYTGNYDQFVKTRSEQEEEQEKRFKSEQDQIKHMKQYISRFGQGNAKMAKQAQSKEKTLDKMLRSGLTEQVEHEKALDFKFPDPTNLAPPVLQCNDITFGYPGCEVLYTGVDFGVDLDSRVALVGPNGAGKSTLLNIMTGDLLPVIGAVRPHPHLRISKFSQHFVDVLDLSMSPLDYFLHLWPDMTREEGRKFLGRFGISGHVQTQIMSQLSDGQKSRVVFAKIAKENPHLLLLDEPTNHLDMESIDSLAKAINNFKGGMVLVSHDMRLISQVAREIWLCDNKTVAKYVGEIADFKMHLRSQILAGSDGTAKKAELTVAPLVPKKMLATSAVEIPTIVPMKVPVVPAAPEVVPPPAPTAQEDSTKTSVIDGKTSTSATTENVDGEVVDEKALAKARRKAEKEAAAALAKKEEEDRQRRREEKLKEAEEAKLLKEAEKKLREEMDALKAQQEAEEKARADAEAAALAEKEHQAMLQRKLRRLEKKAKKIAAEHEQDRLFQLAVFQDVWTQEQQTDLEKALLTYTCTMPKFDRWTAIAAAVNGKTKQQCLARYKYLKQIIINKLDKE